jgi:hypothetical protein
VDGVEGRDRREGAAPRDSFTPEQRFFIGYSQWACQNDRPKTCA